MSGASLYCLLVLCLVIVPLQLFGQDGEEPRQREAIAVWPSTGIDVEAYVPMVVTNLLEGFLIDTDAFVLIDQGEQESIASENGIDLSKLDVQDALSYGAEISVVYLVDSRVRREETNYILEVELYRVADREIIEEWSGRAMSFDELDIVTENIVVDMAKGILPETVLVESRDEKESRLEAAMTPSDELSPLSPGPLLGYLHSGVDFLATGLSGVANYLLLIRSSHLYLEAHEAHEEYAREVEDPQSIYTGSYHSRYREYQNTSIAAYSLLGAGFSLNLANSLFLPASYSTGGRFLYSAGLIFEGLGLISPLFGMKYLLEADREYEKYREAPSQKDASAYDEYDRLFRQGNTLGWLGLASSILGGGLKAGAILLPGERRAMPASGPAKILLGLGDLSIGLGSLSAAVSFAGLYYKNNLEGEYAAAGSTSGDLADEIEEAERFFETLAVGAFSAWGLGIAMKAVALWLPQSGDPPSSQGERIDTLRFLPLPMGGMISLKL